MIKINPKDPDQTRGFPGYRTRPNRSGFDPLDTYAEEYHVPGVFLRNWFTLKVRTRKPFYLVLMFIFA
jgi:hypothetical protein